MSARTSGDWEYWYGCQREGSESAAQVIERPRQGIAVYVSGPSSDPHIVVRVEATDPDGDDDYAPIPLSSVERVVRAMRKAAKEARRQRS